MNNCPSKFEADLKSLSDDQIQVIRAKPLAPIAIQESLSKMTGAEEGLAKRDLDVAAY